MADHSLANANWRVVDEHGKCLGMEHAQLAVLMDIRHELQALNRRLSCHETLAIPRYLRRIAGNTAKPKRKRR